MKMLRLAEVVEITSPLRATIDMRAAVNLPPDAKWGRTAAVGTTTKSVSG
jgi:hypothetical protein